MQKTVYTIVNERTQEIIATSEDLELLQQTQTLLELDNPDDEFEIEQILVTVRIP